VWRVLEIYESIMYNEWRDYRRACRVIITVMKTIGRGKVLINAGRNEKTETLTAGMGIR
jgi:hypothetical protein